MDRFGGSTAAYSLKCRFPRETGRSQAPRRQQDARKNSSVNETRRDSGMVILHKTMSFAQQPEGNQFRLVNANANNQLLVNSATQTSLRKTDVVRRLDTTNGIQLLVNSATAGHYEWNATAGEQCDGWTLRMECNCWLTLTMLRLRQNLNKLTSLIKSGLAPDRNSVFYSFRFNVQSLHGISENKNFSGICTTQYILKYIISG
ncbi:hypothetical protein F511_26219 [Dorcoceras hygrometricum]|uniref:Uncharacterized protein n=1 Tax=Dorcoceras hygrometricum TaxID=472368 RepID=A0A2Z7B0V2_9LAMI|nr:hypothetical protein F511_26219 [Dorcoceras hygrometricum]